MNRSQTPLRRTLRTLSAVAALTAVTGAGAHTGHDTSTVFAGLAHPLGLDHLLAMTAVGVWSAAALPASRRWAGPATFLAAMVFGAFLGAAGLSGAWVETGIAASVVVFGLMLMLARQLPVGAGLAFTAGAALLHGLAHGAELPSGAAFSAYAAGFVATTAALHVAGLGVGHAMLRLQSWAWRAAGAAVSASGVWLLTLA